MLAQPGLGLNPAMLWGLDKCHLFSKPLILVYKEPLK
jgi:hypothetical protein